MSDDLKSLLFAFPVFQISNQVNKLPSLAPKQKQIEADSDNDVEAMTMFTKDVQSRLSFIANFC